jgi:hypothetical protein
MQRIGRIIKKNKGVFDCAQAPGAPKENWAVTQKTGIVVRKIGMKENVVMK